MAMAGVNSSHPSPPQESKHVTSPDVLRLASGTATQLELNLKSDWDPIELATILHSLTIKDIPLDIITRYRLGRLVKSIKKKAQEKENKPIVDVSDQIMAKWRDLLPKNDNQGSFRSPTPSPISSPKIGETATHTPSASSSSSASTTTQHTPFRLALQKDPTPKAKAVTNTAFFDSLSGPSSSYSNTVRPSFSNNSERNPPHHVSLKSLLNNMKRETSTSTSASSSSLTSTGTVITRKRTLEHTAEPTPSSPSSASSPSASSSPTLATIEAPPTRKARQRRVRFKPDYQLVEIREYEKDPEEWNSDHELPADGSPSSSTNPAAGTLINHARDMDISEGKAMSQACHNQQWNDTFYQPQQPPPTMPVPFNDVQPVWYSPLDLLLPDDCILPSPKQSNEITVQLAREQVAPPLHHHMGRLPPTPSGPNEAPVYQHPAVTIPLEEITEEQALELKHQALERATMKHQEDMRQATLKHQADMQRLKRPQAKQKAAALKKEKHHMPPTTPVHLLNPYQPPTSYQQGYQPQPAYAGEPSYQQQQLQLQNFSPPQQLQPQQLQPQQLQPQQYQPQQPLPQATAEQLTILLNSGLLGAITDLVKNLPAAGATSTPGTQPIPQVQQMLHPQTPTYPIPPQQPAVGPSSIAQPASSSAPIPQYAPSFSQYQPRRPRPPFNNNARGRGKKKKKFTVPHHHHGPPGNRPRPPPPMSRASREGAPSHVPNN